MSNPYNGSPGYQELQFHSYRMQQEQYWKGLMYEKKKT